MFLLPEPSFEGDPYDLSLYFFPYQEKNDAIHSFNLYALPNEASEVIQAFPMGTTVHILERLGPWYYIEINNLKGYALCLNILPSLPTDYMGSLIGAITSPQGELQVNVYHYPRFDAPIVNRPFNGQLYDLEFIGDGWYKIFDGYVPKENFMLLYPMPQ